MFSDRSQCQVAGSLCGWEEMVPEIFVARKDFGFIGFGATVRFYPGDNAEHDGYVSVKFDRKAPGDSGLI